MESSENGDRTKSIHEQVLNLLLYRCCYKDKQNWEESFYNELGPTKKKCLIARSLWFVLLASNRKWTHTILMTQ